MPDSGFAFQMAAVVAGALGGALLGLGGGFGGTLARRGEHRRWVDVLFGVVAALGLLTAIVGLVAGGLNQPLSVWLWLVVVGGGLVYLAWGINRHLSALRSRARSSKIVVPGEVDKTR
jgi:peptidoglycan/LPS O-acetylase OafA/YrhL